ncbi:TetR family transcriptional regulator [Sphingomonas sp.]|jgi:AcrR family transcriptional regulator|uniref:TetR family transcriptional regulator n=1 Tax=Sphingomonas sp. TaxID=28214 RepID=UPI002DEFB3A9|nr:TetR family transcriptional regulator [Sphingomonas sp.]HEV2567480.1 TetR family transcriptional regulator [Sphingomonas sp.]
MKIRDQRRDEVLARVVNHLIVEGLAAGSLRQIARATGTSDRMLLYYFRDKDELMTEALSAIAARLAAMLEAASSSERTDFATLLHQLRGVMRSDAFRPFMRLWLELCARAVGCEEPYRAIGAAIADGFIDWAEQRLAGAPQERRAQAALLVATIDGLALLDAVGRGDIADPAIG